VTGTGIERRLGDWARARQPGALVDLIMFVLKQGWACLFGGLLLVALLVTRALWSPDWALHRYDALLVFALLTQALFLRFGLETWAEARVIRIFEMRFAPYPPLWMTWALAAGIYLNFFAHHFLPDIRIGLLAATVLVFGRTRVWFCVAEQDRWMPMVVAGALSAGALWLAENVGTATGTWLYSGQRPDHLVSFAKLGSWYLLLYVAFFTVTLVSRDALDPGQTNPRQ
jgi:uncharacterized membrane protein YoaT (DUF817 family)